MLAPTIHNALPAQDLLLPDGIWSANGPQGLWVRGAAEGAQEPPADDLRAVNARVIRAWVAAADAGGTAHRVDLARLKRYLRTELRPCPFLRGLRPAPSWVSMRTSAVDAPGHVCSECRRTPGYSAAVLLPILGVPTGVALLCRAIEDCTGVAAAVVVDAGQVYGALAQMLALVTPGWVFVQMQSRGDGGLMLQPYQEWVVGADLAAAAAQVAGR